MEKVNLRVGKNINLNYSCADVVWNPVEGFNVLFIIIIISNAFF